MGASNIYLIGFMGAGKTTIGKLLAGLLSRPFLDLDHEVVARAGKDIPAIFKDEGEPAFREWETRTLKELSGPAVIAPGGGAFMSEENRAWMRAHGKSVYLEWPLEVLKGRVAGDPNRPLAQDAEAFAALFYKRQFVYGEADLIWQSKPPHDTSPVMIAQNIRDMIMN